MSEAAPAGSATVVAILGMHRSGTSWLTGSLQELGLQLGKVWESEAPGNAKGDRERWRFRDIHNRVLEDNGGSWNHPSWPNVWSHELREALTAQIASLSKRYSLWGFKDPRTLMVIDEWHRQVPALKRVGIYRHPHAVARSLVARDDHGSFDEGLDLWQTYNVRLVEELRREPFPLLSFDWPQGELVSALEAAARRLGLPADRPSEFYDSTLVHSGDTDSEPIPAALSDVWEELGHFAREWRS